MEEVTFKYEVAERLLDALKPENVKSYPFDTLKEGKALEEICGEHKISEFHNALKVMVDDEQIISVRYESGCLDWTEAGKELKAASKGVFKSLFEVMVDGCEILEQL